MVSDRVHEPDYVLHWLMMSSLLLLAFWTVCGVANPDGDIWWRLLEVGSGIPIVGFGVIIGMCVGAYRRMLRRIPYVDY